MILVSGANGFLGQRLVRELAASGHTKIRGLVRPAASAEHLTRLVEDFPQVDLELVRCTLDDSATLRDALQGVGIVYHVAAAKHGSAAVMVASTVVGSDNLFRAALDVGVPRVVLVSSMSVVGVAHLARNALIDESLPLEQHPEWRDSYAFSKQRQEALAWKYSAMGLPLVVVRPGVIFGPGSDILHPRVGVQLFGLFLHLGGGNAIPLTYVDNCAGAVALAGTVRGIEGETVHIVDDDLPTSRHILRRYCREVRRLRVLRIHYALLKLMARCNQWYSRRTEDHLPVVFPPYQVPTLWKRFRFSNRKAKQILSWRPEITMQRGLDLTYQSLCRDGRSSGEQQA